MMLYSIGSPSTSPIPRTIPPTAALPPSAGGPGSLTLEEVTEILVNTGYATNGLVTGCNTAAMWCASLIDATLARLCEMVGRRLREHGLHARTIEVLDQRGIADRFLAEGQVAQVHGFAQARLDISDFPTRHPYGLGLWQNHIERILAGWADELKVTVYREREVTDFAQDDAGVDVQLSGGESMRAEYLVGCDGGRSLVRKAAGIEFPGWDPTTSALIAEVEVTEQPPLGIHRTALGIHSFGKREYEIRDGQVVFKSEGPLRVMVPERHPGAGGEPTLRDLREALVAVCGTDYGVHSPTWISRFTDMTRQAATYRRGREVKGAQGEDLADAAGVGRDDGDDHLKKPCRRVRRLRWPDRLR